MMHRKILVTLATVTFALSFEAQAFSQHNHWDALRNQRAQSHFVEMLAVLALACYRKAVVERQTTSSVRGILVTSR